MCVSCKEIHDQVFASTHNLTRLLVGLHKDVGAALCAASRHGKLDVVQHLIERYGADARFDKHAPLRVAAENGHSHVVQLLVEKYGADVHTCDDAPLRRAAQNGHVHTVDLLCGTHGANVRAMLGWDGMPLIRAVTHGQTSVVELLCARYRALEPPTESCVAAWAVEAVQKKVEMLDMLCERFGADARCGEDLPFRLAAAYCHPKSVRLLCEHYGADVRVRDDEALRMASKARHVHATEEELTDPTSRAHILHDAMETIQFLCSKGADVHARNEEPLRNAARYGAIEIVKLLCERYGATCRDPVAIVEAKSTIDRQKSSPDNNGPFALEIEHTTPYKGLVLKGCAAVIEYLSAADHHLT